MRRAPWPLRVLALVFLVCCGCKHPEVVKADAAAQAGAASATDTGAVAAAQSGSTAAAVVDDQPDDLHLEVTTPTDGGPPVFKLDLHRGARHVAVSGHSEADAGAEAAAGAGATAQADAGAGASVTPASKPFWSLSRLVTLLVGIAVAVGLAILALKALARRP